ncbi:hypothetical protein FBU30_004533 [Linnemannia zychae]|nr:hypothetical protein FBU30_004533 [Linnemannia zychae]
MGTTLPVRLYTHNIRYAASPSSKNELPWPKRAPLIIASIRFHTRHNPQAIICLQEVLHHQLLDILDGLGSDWVHVGVGRDDGQKGGEYSPILFRHSVWAIQSTETIWLSPTPHIPSKGWDAALKRILTSVTLRHLETGVRVLGLNTHFDHLGVQARLESAKIILAHIMVQTEQYQPDQPQLLPVFLAGDFNSTPDEEAYTLLAAADSPIQDLRNVVGKKERYGHNNTFTGFESRPIDQKRIDFLFASKEGQWRVDGYGVLETRFEDGVFSSDHRPVVSDLSLLL